MHLTDCGGAVEPGAEVDRFDQLREIDAIEAGKEFEISKSSGSNAANTAWSEWALSPIVA